MKFNWQIIQRDKDRHIRINVELLLKVEKWKMIGYWIMDSNFNIVHFIVHLGFMEGK